MKWDTLYQRIQTAEQAVQSRPPAPADIDIEGVLTADECAWMAKLRGRFPVETYPGVAMLKELTDPEIDILEGLAEKVDLARGIERTVTT